MTNPHPRHYLNECDCADKMLTDCGCVAHVYSDGSGVDLTYCDTHAGSDPTLLAAIRAALARLGDVFGHADAPYCPPALEAMATLREAIEKAKPR